VPGIQHGGKGAQQQLLDGISHRAQPRVAMVDVGGGVERQRAL
jgi:hypothetical protein